MKRIQGFLFNFFFVLLLIICNTFVCMADSRGDPKGVNGETILLLRFNEGEGEVAKDDSKNEIDGKIFGAGWVKGKIDSVLLFDGIDDHVKSASSNHLNLSGSSFTLETWYYSSNIGGFKTLLMLGRSNYLYGYQLDSNRFLAYDSNDNLIQIMSNATNNEWNHVVVVHDLAKTTVSVYRNGTLQSNVNYSPATGLRNQEGDFAIIGADSGGAGAFFSGAIDEIRIYKDPLSAAEISQNYLKGIELRDVELKGLESESSLTEKALVSFSNICKRINFNPEDSSSFYFVQFTDTHIGLTNAVESFQNVTKQIASLKPKPAFVVITGDLVDAGNEENWGTFHRLETEFEKQMGKVPVHILLGNHDNQADIYMRLFPERKLYYSFDLGGLSFISLFPYPNKLITEKEGADFPFNEREVKFNWFSDKVSSYSGKTLVILCHTPPMFTDLWTPYLIDYFQYGLKEVNPETNLWIIAGHTHGNGQYHIADLLKAQLPYIMVTEPAVGGQVYRVFFVCNGEIVGSALKSIDKPFQLDPNSPDAWKTRWLFYPEPTLLLVDMPQDKDYLITEGKGSVGAGGAWIIEHNGYLIYRVPLVQGTRNLGAYTAWEYLIETSSDGENWKEIANSTWAKRPFEDTRFPLETAHYKLLIPLPEELLKEEFLSIRFRDPNPDNKYDPVVDWFSLVGLKDAK